MLIEEQKKSEEPALQSLADNNQTTPATVVPLPRLAYTMRETAEILGVNYQTIYRLHKRGLIRSSGALRTKLFPVTEIERFLKSTAA